jgi:hypothetical protein
LLGHRARVVIGATTGSEGQYQPNRFVRIGLWLRERKSWHSTQKRDEPAPMTRRKTS